MKGLTLEIGDTNSPVRQFLDERFTRGFKDVQRRFREAGPPMVVPSAPSGQASPNTVGTAAELLLRFMVCPAPTVNSAFTGACFMGPPMMRAVTELAALLGIDSHPYRGMIFTEIPDDGSPMSQISGLRAPIGSADFTGPVAGSSADPDLLAQGCWALALATEARRSPQALASGPLTQFGSKAVTADELLTLAPPAGLAQLTEFRRVFKTTLIPQLVGRTGRWVLEPTFPGSKMPGDAPADLMAAGLLLELKTLAKPTLTITNLWQMVTYALLDFNDEYHLDSVGIFNARYAYLATWGLGTLLDELAGHPVSLQATRDEFRQLLLAHQPTDRAG